MRWTLVAVVEVEVRGVGTEPGDDRPVLVLQERHGERRCVPIWIGAPEAVALAAAGADPAATAEPRPLTHRLLLDVLGVLGAALEQCLRPVDEVGGVVPSV